TPLQHFPAGLKQLALLAASDVSSRFLAIWIGISSRTTERNREMLQSVRCFSAIERPGECAI
ncbi:MAG: hypothetical protein ABI164_09060, partial [Acidobacteriaceae bacterium]